MQSTIRHGLRRSMQKVSLRQTTSTSTTRCRTAAAAAVGSQRSFLSASTTLQQQHYAAIDHGAAYEASLAGPHGKQLELAKLEGLGKDDAPFDPFIEEELEEARLLAAIEEGDEIVETPAEAKGEFEDDIERTGGESGYEEDSDEEDWKMKYNNDGSLKRSKAEKAILAAGSPAGGLFAVVELAGSQYKITTDDVLIVNRLKPVSDYKIGSIHTLKDEQVLLLGSSHYTLVGMPSIQGAEVDVMVEEITKDAKVIIFSKRRRKNSKRKNGFRRDVTMLRILDIRPPASHATTYYNERLDPKPLEQAIA